MDDEDDRDYDDDYCPPDAVDEDLWEECRLGDRCCCPDPFHRPEECFTAEWAESYFEEQLEDRPLCLEHDDHTLRVADSHVTSA